MTSAIAIAKVRLATFCTRDFDSYGVPAHDSLSSLLKLSSSVSTRTEFLKIFPLMTYEYRTVIGMHSTVWGDEQFYGHVPDPFPRCGTGSGHVRLYSLE